MSLAMRRLKCEDMHGTVQQPTVDTAQAGRTCMHACTVGVPWFLNRDNRLCSHTSTGTWCCLCVCQEILAHPQFLCFCACVFHTNPPIDGSSRGLAMAWRTCCCSLLWRDHETRSHCMHLSLYVVGCSPCMCCRCSVLWREHPRDPYPGDGHLV